MDRLSAVRPFRAVGDRIAQRPRAVSTAPRDAADIGAAPEKLRLIPPPTRGTEQDALDGLVARIIPNGDGRPATLELRPFQKRPEPIMAPSESGFDSRNVYNMATVREDDRPTERQVALLRLADRVTPISLTPERRAEIQATALAASKDTSALVRSAAAACLGALAVHYENADGLIGAMAVSDDACFSRLTEMAAADEAAYVRADALLALRTAYRNAAKRRYGGEMRPALTLLTALEHALREDPEPLVRRTVVQITAAEGAPRQTPPVILETALLDKDPGVAFAARKALEALPAAEPVQESR